ncbi:hypothetical protein ACFYY8_13885 [Streptosporangium sp. NPDC001559]
MSDALSLKFDVAKVLRTLQGDERPAFLPVTDEQFELRTLQGDE